MMKWQQRVQYNPDLWLGNLPYIHLNIACSKTPTIFDIATIALRIGFAILIIEFRIYVSRSDG